MSVSLSPSNSLGFRRPLTQLVKRSLTITNHNSQPVAFKVKTTAPKLYCVRPNSGRVEPGESIDVSVMLQALKEEPPLNTKCKDKFLIQSTIITPEKETMSLQDIWASTDGNEEGKVYQQKLRVTYLPAEGQTLEEEDETAHANMMLNMANDISHANGHPPAQSDFQPPPGVEERPSTPPADFSVAREESHEHQPLPLSQEVPIVHEPLHRAPTPPLPEPEAPAPLAEPVAERDVSTSYEPSNSVEHIPASIPIPVPAPAPVIITKENPVNEELYVKYKEAQLEIERLRNELVTMSVAPPPVSELRRRRASSDVGSSAETDVETMVQAPLQQEGVPLNVVVIIAFGVFVMTYLFF